MRNTAFFPEFQGQGLYMAFLAAFLPILRDVGFQIATSNHHPTNHAVLIPKLRAGFTITGMKLTDMFGTLITLEYRLNRDRQAVLAWRCGHEPLPQALGEKFGVPPLPGR